MAAVSTPKPADGPAYADNDTLFPSEAAQIRICAWTGRVTVAPHNGEEGLATASSSESFSVGTSVTLLGLVSRPELNGQHGEVVAAVDGQSGRLRVSVNNAVLALKPANVRLAKMKLCSGCGEARYADVAAQRSAWPNHKKWCQKGLRERVTAMTPEAIVRCCAGAHMPRRRGDQDGWEAHGSRVPALVAAVSPELGPTGRL
jgi:MYND finger